MDVYGVSAPPEMFRIDDLLDFSNAEIFSPSSSSAAAAAAESEHHNYHLPYSAETSSAANNGYFNPIHSNHSSADFANDLCVPSEEAAELEWLSAFVEDSFSDIAANSTMNLGASAASFQGRSRSKRSRSAVGGGGGAWTAAAMQSREAAVAHEISRQSANNNNNNKRESSEEVPRRCTHCASEKTPQWRTGPLGPKTLCNACGVRYKSGRLVPEYRPAASPTFVLTQHSNSHRKVLELRRQKELLRQQQQQQQEMYGRHFQVC